MNRNDPVIDALHEIEHARRSQAEPDWDAIAAAIRRECDQISARRDRSVWARLFGGRRGLVAAAAVVAAVAIGLVVTRPQPALPLTSMTPAGDMQQPAAMAPAPTSDLRAAEVNDLDDREMDELAHRLDSLLGEQGAGWWAGGDSAVDDLLATPGSVWPEPNYEQFVDDLSDDQIDALDDYLDSVQTG